MDAIHKNTDKLKEAYLVSLYGNPHIASFAPDIHGINFAVSRLDQDTIGTLRISFSIDFVGRNLFTRDRKLLRDYSLLPIEFPEEDGKPYTHSEVVMMAIHVLMDQVETEWINMYVKKIEV